MSQQLLEAKGKNVCLKELNSTIKNSLDDDARLVAVWAIY